MASKPHIMVVESRFYEDVADALVDGVTAALEAGGAGSERFRVAGAFEIPAAINYAVQAMKAGGQATHYDGFIALGCVIRGETTHYDYVCQESARALQDLALAHTLALGYAILTVENHDQALARARRDQYDRGGHAARACLGMIALKRQLGVPEV